MFHTYLVTRAPRGGWGRCVYHCATGASPTIPSGLGHKYHSVSQGPGVGAVPASVGMTTGPVFPKASLSEAAGEWGSELQAAGGTSLQWVSAFHRGCLLPTALPGLQKEERKPMQPRLLEFPETGKAQWGPQNLLAVLPPLCAKRGNMVWDNLQLADTWFGTNTCPCSLSVRHTAPGSIK